MNNDVKKNTKPPVVESDAPAAKEGVVASKASATKASVKDNKKSTPKNGGSDNKPAITKQDNKKAAKKEKTQTKVFLKNSVVKKVKKRAQFIFKEAIQKIEGDFNQGDLVGIYALDGEFIGNGFANPIAAKNYISLVTWDGVEFTEQYIIEKITIAYNLKRQFFFRKHETFRLIDSENDFLHGLIIDKFKDTFVVTVLTPGWLKFLHILEFALENRYSHCSIYLNIDNEIKKTEKINDKSRTLRGDVRSLQLNIEENGYKFHLNFADYEEIKNFTASRKIREQLGNYVVDKKVLVLFPDRGVGVSYLLGAGAKSVKFVCNKKATLEFEKKNTKLNSYYDEEMFVNSDPFKYLNDLSGNEEEKYDMVIIHNPSFIKANISEHDLKRIKGLLTRVFNILNKNGLVFDMVPGILGDAVRYKKMLLDASVEAQRGVSVLDSFTFPSDLSEVLTFKTRLDFTNILFRVE